MTSAKPARTASSTGSAVIEGDGVVVDSGTSVGVPVVPDVDAGGCEGDEAAGCEGVPDAAGLAVAPFVGAPDGFGVAADDGEDVGVAVAAEPLPWIVTAVMSLSPISAPDMEISRRMVILSLPDVWLAIAVTVTLHCCTPGPK